MKSAMVLAIGIVGIGIGASGGVMAQSGQSLGAIAEAGAEDLAQIPVIIDAVLYLAGTIIGIAGIVMFKRHTSNPRDNAIGNAVMTVCVGVALLTAPFWLEGLANTFGVEADAGIDRPTLVE